MTEVKAKPYSPEYELARELIAGEFSSVFRDNPEVAWTQHDIEKLANVILREKDKHSDIVSLVESNAVQDDLNNLTAYYQNKLSAGGSVTTKTVSAKGAIERNGIKYKLVSQAFSDEKDKADAAALAYANAGYKSFVEPVEGGYGVYAIWKVMNPEFGKGGSVDLFFGMFGNGVSVSNKNKEKNGEYEQVAHISEDGAKIKYYEKNLPEKAIKEIEASAERQKKLFGAWGGSTGWINYGGRITDRANRTISTLNSILASEPDNEGFTPITLQNLISLRTYPDSAYYDIEYGDGDFALINKAEALKGGVFENNITEINDYLDRLQYEKGGNITDVWSANDGEVYKNNEVVGRYEFDQDSDAFWINGKGLGQTAFDTKEALLNHFKSVYARGGRIRNYSRDRKFVSQEYWEQAYKPHRATKGKRYHRYGEGGIVTASELVGQTFFVGDATGSGNFVFAHGFSAYDTERLAEKLTILNQSNIPFFAEYQHGSTATGGHWDILVLEEDYPEVITLFSAEIDEEQEEVEFEIAQERAGQFAKGGTLGKEIKLRQWNYDVWGNDEDGYSVNDRFKTPTVVTLYENQTDEQIIEALKEQGVLSAKANKDNVEIDGEIEYALFLNDLSGISPKPLLELANEAPQMATGGAVEDNTMEIEGVTHTRSVAAHLHHNSSYKRIEGSGHPLGDVYVKKYNPKYGYVPSGYFWYKFDLKKWNEKNPNMQIGSELLAKGGKVRNLHRDRMFISKQDWEQSYFPNRVKRGKRYRHHYANGGEVGSALAWLKSLDLNQLPKVVSKHLKVIIDNPESENIELGDSDFVELKNLVEAKFSSAIPIEATPEPEKKEEVKVEQKEVPLSVLKTRIKIITSKMKAEPKNAVWKTRFKIVSKMIEKRG
jgi:translation initiation factor 1 (eIF-1/SUI1)